MKRKRREKQKKEEKEEKMKFKRKWQAQLRKSIRLEQKKTSLITN